MSRLPLAEDTIDRLPARGSTFRSLYRIAEVYPDPIYWSKEGRYGPKSKKFGVYYVGTTLTAAIAESLLHGAGTKSAAERIVTIDQAEKKHVFQIDVHPTLDLLNFDTPRLPKYGLDARIYTEILPTGGYEYGPSWSDHAKGLGFNGILYPSRHTPKQTAIALFERPKSDISVKDLGPVIDSAEALEIIVDDFGWGLV